MTLKSPLNWNEFLDDWSRQSEKTERALLLRSLFDFGPSLCDGYTLKTQKEVRNDGYLPRFQAVMLRSFFGVNSGEGFFLRETQFIKGFSACQEENPGRGLRTVLELVCFQLKVKFRLSNFSWGIKGLSKRSMVTVNFNTVLAKTERKTDCFCYVVLFFGLPLLAFENGLCFSSSGL